MYRLHNLVCEFISEQKHAVFIIIKCLYLGDKSKSHNRQDFSNLFLRIFSISSITTRYSALYPH